MITIRCTRSRGPRGFFCLQDVRRGPVNVDVITLHMKFRLSTLMLLTTLLCCALGVLAHDYGHVVVMDGSYDVPVTLKNRHIEETTFVAYAMIDESQLNSTIDNYPSSEPQFHEINGDSASIRVRTTHKVSPLLERNLEYNQSCNCIVFRIEYAAGETAFVIERDWWRARDMGIEIDVSETVKRHRN